LIGSWGAQRLPAITTPKTASQKNSHVPNFMASAPRAGVNRARLMNPMSVPIVEAVTDSPMAWAALPCKASG
jgi:hypothetical protein